MYWETLNDLDRSREYHALMREGLWKTFRNVVFHHNTIDHTGRRARGGQDRAFYDNLNAGLLTIEERNYYLRTKAEMQRHSAWTEL